MNVSYRWLKEMVPGLELSASEAAEHLALRGAPVEQMSSPGKGLSDVVVGKVLTAGRHPNADRLSLCTVDAGSGSVQVVCGAPNVKEGAWYPFAPVGATLPGGIKLKRVKIRGEYSEGMLCSARELGLGTDHAGILEIRGDFTPGQAFVEALGLDDVTLDVEITSNRGDLLSHQGIARELAAEGTGETCLPPIPEDPGITLEYDTGAPVVEVGGVSVRIDDADLCSRYLGAVIRGVSIGPSPPWLQKRLRGAGARPINNVVDATNYVMLELGQPLHAFDLHRLRGHAIVVRRAGPDETTFVTLDDEVRELGRDMLMICDAERPVAVAGVMGGQDSEVSEETTDILLECALFDPRSIRRTRRALVMSTDASYRFERGVDPEGMRRAVERAVAIILATAGGDVDGPVLDACPAPFEPQVVPLRLGRIAHVLGVALDPDTVRGCLEPLGFVPEREEDGTLHLRVPGYRSYDVTREIDLIEEVARAHGYDVFPEVLSAYRPGNVPDHPMFQLEDELRRDLAARGLFEAQTPGFAPEGEGDVQIANPLNTKEPFMRRAILPSLLRSVEYNLARGNRHVRLFEIATSFRFAGSGEPPQEETHLAAVVTGARTPPHWSTSEDPFTVWDLKGLLEDVLERAYGGSGRLEPAMTDSDVFSADAGFVLRDGEGTVVGQGGRVRAESVDAPVWAGDVWGLELTLPAVVIRAPAPVFERLPQFPAVERDLAVLVPDQVPVGRVLEVAEDSGGPLLEAVHLFDHYRGEGVPAGHRSVAFGLRFRAPDRTLKDKEADRAVSSIVKRLKEELGVEPRG
ncbi:MAG: phenylalanine--tRNA ligase subunit beta [Gemmatimonadota bacterium]